MSKPRFENEAEALAWAIFAAGAGGVDPHANGRVHRACDAADAMLEEFRARRDGSDSEELIEIEDDGEEPSPEA